MNTEEAKRFALGLMEASETVYLTTIDDHGFPQTRAMLNLRNALQHPTLVELFAPHKDDLLVYFTTNTSSAKMGHIGANPAVSAYYCVPAYFHGLMLGGTIEVVADARLKKAFWQPGWDMYYPGGADDPDYAILSLLPVLAKGWHGSGRFDFRLDQ